MRTLHGKFQNLAMATGIWKYLPSIYVAENKRTLEKLSSEVSISANF